MVEIGQSHTGVAVISSLMPHESFAFCEKEKEEKDSKDTDSLSESYSVNDDNSEMNPGGRTEKSFPRDIKADPSFTRQIPPQVYGPHPNMFISFGNYRPPLCSLFKKKKVITPLI